VMKFLCWAGVQRKESINLYHLLQILEALP